MSLANPLYFEHQRSPKVSSQGNQISMGYSALISPKLEHPRAFYFGGIFSKLTNLSQFALHILQQVLHKANLTFVFTVAVTRTLSCSTTQSSHHFPQL